MILKFMKHDLYEGIFRYKKRFVLLIFLCVTACIMLDRSTEYFRELYGQDWSPLEYGISHFFGRHPFDYDVSHGDTFTVPFEWAAVYLILAYCTGDYIIRDMKGFGMHMMVKSKKRSYWWISKCIWCLAVNAIYFTLVWGVYTAYSWMMHGQAGYDKHLLLLQSSYGDIFESMPLSQLFCMTMLLPFMAGIAQSFIQMILSLICGAAQSMVILTFLLVGSCYYGNPLLPHGYAMVVRYFPSDLVPSFQPNSIRGGILYLCIFIVLSGIGGYMIVRKKDVYGE